MRKIEYNNRHLDISNLIAGNLKRLRGTMFKAELARRSGVSRTTIDNLEEVKGKRLPHIATLMKIADALGVGLDELFKKPHEPINREGEIGDALDKIISDNGYFIQFLDRYFERKMKEKNKT